nr:hypothetical protein [Tanacetum cinerariifolium]
MKIRRQSRIRKQFLKNNLTLKLSLSRIQIQGPFLPKDQSQIQSNAKLKSPGTNCAIFSKIVGGTKVAKCSNFKFKKDD